MRPGPENHLMHKLSIKISNKKKQFTTISNNVVHTCVLLPCNISNSCKCKNSNQETGECVDERNGKSVKHNLIIEPVVTGKRYHRSKSNAHRVEDLRCSIDPNLQKRKSSIKKKTKQKFGDKTDLSSCQELPPGLEKIPQAFGSTL